MEYSINALAKMAGITTRTLRHYHQIELLLPCRVSSAGYRIYGQKEVDRLQQILFYKELGLELSQIKEILDNPHFNTQAALQEHLEQLVAKRTQIDILIKNAQQTLLHQKGDYAMSDTEKFAGFKQQMIEQNEEKYGDEIRANYGNDTVNASNQRMLNMTSEEYARFQTLSAQLNEALKSAVATHNYKSEAAQTLAQLHKDWLCFTWPSYSAEAHKGLTDMYVQDERFTAYYENIVPGGAQFLRDAVYYFIGENNG